VSTKLEAESAKPLSRVCWQLCQRSSKNWISGSTWDSQDYLGIRSHQYFQHRHVGNFVRIAQLPNPPCTWVCSNPQPATTFSHNPNIQVETLLERITDLEVSISGHISKPHARLLPCVDIETSNHHPPYHCARKKQKKKDGTDIRKFPNAFCWDVWRAFIFYLFQVYASKRACLTLMMTVRINHAETEDVAKTSSEEHYFLRKEHPSVNLAFPPVGWQRTVEQPAQITTVCAQE